MGATLSRWNPKKRSRKTPPQRCPNGDPQWFPTWWLVVVRESESETQSEEFFLEAPD
jgi:hypothetical protein